MLLAHRWPEELAPLHRALSQEYAVAVTRGADEAAGLAAEARPRLAVVAMELEGGSGLQLVRRLPRAGDGGRPLIVKAADPRLAVARTHGLVDAVLPLPAAPGLMVSAVWRLLDAAKERALARLAAEPRRLVEETRTAFDAAVAAAAAGLPVPLARIADAARAIVDGARAGALLPALDALRGHHAHTYVHSLKVAANLARLGLATRMRAADVELLAQAGLAHDLGKSLVPAEILNKPGPLDESERRLLRRHPEAGAEALRAAGGAAETIVLATARHHERLDGGGYPRGLDGRALDEVSLLVAVADVHAALTEPRAYKPALDDAAALAVMRRQLGTHLEPALFAAYERAVRDTAVGQDAATASCLAA